jgi:hypothetical protein
VSDRPGAEKGRRTVDWLRGGVFCRFPQPGDETVTAQKKAAAQCDRLRGGFYGLPAAEGSAAGAIRN